MPTFKFTVVAVGEDLQSNENRKTLLDLGCGDATVGQVDDLQYLNFTREAESFGEAVLTAVSAVENVQGVNVINLSTDGSVKRPQLSPDHVQAALEGLMTFRLHAAGLAAGIQESLLAISQRPTQGVCNWLKHVSPSQVVPAPVPSSTAPSSAEWIEPSPVLPPFPSVAPPAAAIDHEPQEQQRHGTPAVVQVAPEDNPTFDRAPWADKPKWQGKCPGKVVSVCANKGGVGKSTIALWLAESMHSTGSRTCLVDADLAHPQLLRMTGNWRANILGLRRLICNPGAHYTATDRQEAIVPIPGFMDILSGSSEPIAEDEMTLTTLRRVIEDLRTDYDWIIVDYSAANGKKLSMSKVLAPTSDAVVVVLTPDHVTIHNTSQLVNDMVMPLERSGLGKTKDQLIMVLNRVYDDPRVTVAGLEKWIPSLNIQEIPKLGDQAPRSKAGSWQCPPLAKDAVDRITNWLINGADPQAAVTPR